MNDGTTYEPAEKPFGRVVFVFGGGVFDTAEKLKNEARRYTRYDKLPDFVRRVDVWLDLKPIAFPWDTPQHDAATMLAPRLKETISERNVVVDWQTKQLLLQLSGVDERKPPLSGGHSPSIAFDLTRLPMFVGQRTANAGTRSDALGSKSASANSPSGPTPSAEANEMETEKANEAEAEPAQLQSEIFFALLKRALFLRSQIERRAKGNERSDRRPHRFDMKSNNWIATNVALFLLHPAMRLRDGLGSLEKFIQMIDFQLDRRFERNHLPDRTEYRELLAIGPELGPPGLTD